MNPDLARIETQAKVLDHNTWSGSDEGLEGFSGENEIYQTQRMSHALLRARGRK